MIYKLLFIIAYLVLMPIGVGRLSRLVLWSKKSLSQENFVEGFLESFVSGLLVEFFLFESVGMIVISSTQSYSGFLEIMEKISSRLLVVSLVSLVLFSVYDFIKKLRRDLEDEKLNWPMLIFAVAYIAVAVLFVAPNSADETIINIIAMMKADMVAEFDPFSYWLLSEMTNRTKLIEMFYAMGADITGVGINQFVAYIINVVFLVFFFGVYKRIESILTHHCSFLMQNKKRMEVCFFAICTALLFINGSVYLAIPNNIWNGYTLFAACVMPLCFAYGYAAIVESTRGQIAGGIYWVLQMVLLMPVAALLYDYGYQMDIFLIIITVIVMIVVALVNTFIKEKERA